MTNLQKIQQETDETFDKEEFARYHPATKTAWEMTKEDIKSFIHSRESIAYKAGYADCANDVKKLSK